VPARTLYGTSIVFDDAVQLLVVLLSTSVPLYLAQAIRKQMKRSFVTVVAGHGIATFDPITILGLSNGYGAACGAMEIGHCLLFVEYDGLPGPALI